MTEIRTLDRLEAVPEPLPPGNFVIADVIIASTTIIRLLEEGPRYVRPFVDIEPALQFKREVDDAVLVGEDGGDDIDGFDLSPLPSEFRTADLDDRPVGFRSTNGTRGIGRVREADGVFVGSTINARAVAAELASREGDVWLVAAGRYGSPAPEDMVGVALIESYLRERLGEAEVDDETLASHRDVIEASETGQWLRDLGKTEDLEDVLSLNATSTVPELQDGRFVVE